MYGGFNRILKDFAKGGKERKLVLNSTFGIGFLARVSSADRLGLASQRVERR